MSWQLDIKLFAVTSNKSARIIQVCPVFCPAFTIKPGVGGPFVCGAAGSAVAQYEADLSFSCKTSKYLTCLQITRIHTILPAHNH